LFSRVGTSDLAADPMPPNAADTYVIMKPRDEWPDPGMSKDDLIRQLEAEASKSPGNKVEFSQPIQMRFFAPARRFCSFSNAIPTFRSAARSSVRGGCLCGFRLADLWLGFLEVPSWARSLGSSACSLNAPLEPTGRFRTTPGAAAAMRKSYDQSEQYRS
jgi:AcrB/AcrD/AcrF family protein